jgi:glyoxylase-like metal-dependent hydrolase (beta-lactamase superfamily II)
VLAEPGSHDAVVIDPGPQIDDHLDAVRRAVAERDAAVGLIVLTHGHLDHSESARRFAGLVGAPVRALDPAMRLGDEGLAGGDVVDVGGLELRVVATPGHTSDSLSFLLPADQAVLTGDTVLGRGTTVVAHPDGRLADYLESLDRLAALARSGAVRTVLPGHGPVLGDAYGAISYYQRHRAERLAQVELALAAGARTLYEIVQVVYADVDRALWPAAELSVRAQVEYLARR